VTFNANVCTKSHNKLWYGDLDITKSLKQLKAAAKELGEDIFILREHDGRSFNATDRDKEESPDLSSAYVTINADGGFAYQIPKHVVKEKGKWLYAPLVLPKKHTPKYTDQYKKSEFRPIKRPRFSKGNKKHHPLELFLSNKAFSKLKCVSEIYLLPKEYAKLEELMRQWFIKHTYLKKGSYGLHKEMSWLTLSMPGEFRDCTIGPIWATPGKCYIKRE